MTMSNAATAAPVAKKRKISQFRRLLWHVNRTDLGWVTKTALTAFNWAHAPSGSNCSIRFPSGRNGARPAASSANKVMST